MKLQILVQSMNSSRGKSAGATARPIKSLRGIGMMKSTGTTAPSHKVFEREGHDEVYRYYSPVPLSL